MIEYPDSGARIQETEFERRRGISRLEVREGLSQAQVQCLGHSINDKRLAILQKVAEVGISIDFLKLTPSGLSFLVADQDASELEALLATQNCMADIQRGRHVVSVYAVNMRDEAGLIAGIISEAIQSGSELGHMTDMHDRMLIVISSEESPRLVGALQSMLANGGDDAGH